MIPKVKAHTSLFKGDVNFLTFRPSQLKPLNHLIKKRWKTDRQRPKEKGYFLTLYHKELKITSTRAIRRLFHANSCNSTQKEESRAPSLPHKAGQLQEHQGLWHSCREEVQRQAGLYMQETQPCKDLCVSLECHPFYSMKRERQPEKSTECFPQPQSVGLRNNSDKKRKQKIFNLQRGFFVRRKTCIRKIIKRKIFFVTRKRIKP